VLRGGLLTMGAPLTTNGVDGDAFAVVYGYGPGGTIDGGNFADALSPATMNLDGGTFV